MTDMDITEFVETGYVFEVNRQVLHPAGLALAWADGWTREQFEQKMSQAGFIYGEDAMCNAWAAVCVLGLDKPHLAGVVDERDDPEGMFFSVEQFDRGEGKIERVREAQKAKVEVRDATGFTAPGGIQVVGATPVE